MKRVEIGECLVVSREEHDRWSDDPVLRSEVQLQIGERFMAVTTLGGYVVDVWEQTQWQSGASNGAA